VRRLLALCLLLAFTCAHAQDRSIRIFLYTQADEKPLFTGDRVPSNKRLKLLFLQEPCPLHIVGSQDMHRAWVAAGAYQVGCWFPTLQDEYTYINGMGQEFHAQGDFWQAYPRAALHPDGSITITEPDFDSRRFFTDVTQQIVQSHLDGLLRSQKP
jgi:hypothetical protein